MQPCPLFFRILGYHMQFDSCAIQEKTKKEGMITSVKDINPKIIEDIFTGVRRLYFFKTPTKETYTIRAGKGMHVKESIVSVLVLKVFENSFVKIVKTVFQILMLLRIRIAQKIYAINQQYLD